MRKIASIVLLGCLVTAGPLASAASAGGNWLEFRRADGERSPIVSMWGIGPVGASLVARVGYLQRSFGSDDRIHLWLEGGEAVQPGAAIPASAIRLATFQMNGGGTGGHATFVVPSLPSGRYTFSVCGDPCTDAEFGFGESVMGWLTVTQTMEEARLLARVREVRSTLGSRIREERRDLAAAERRGDDLATQLGETRGALEASRAEIGRLTRSAAAARADDRALVDAAGAAWIALGLVAVAAAVAWTRRRVAVVVPDTPAELLEEGFRPATRR